MITIAPGDTNSTAGRFQIQKIKDNMIKASYFTSFHPLPNERLYFLVGISILYEILNQKQIVLYHTTDGVSNTKKAYYIC